ncbi:hypothetical protein [Janibacter terrae]|uniref:hypothetical protein n=1 Tax=Janibacter terrae TaxID=103817 RepID=UPI0031F76F23
MPEMTQARIDALAQSARERDPNPEPLDAPEPARADRRIEVDWTKGDGTQLQTHYTGPLTYEVSQEGDLHIFCHDDGDDSVCFARGTWQRAANTAVEEAR